MLDKTGFLHLKSTGGGVKELALMHEACTLCFVLTSGLDDPQHHRGAGHEPGLSSQGLFVRWKVAHHRMGAFWTSNGMAWVWDDVCPRVDVHTCDTQAFFRVHKVEVTGREGD